MESRRKYLTEFVDDQVAIRCTNIIEDAVRDLEKASEGGLTFDVTLKVREGEHAPLEPGDDVVWRYVVGRTKGVDG